ncbi:MAG: orotidine-5'-phosphate decarboxylase [Clostridiales bacterium]|nr:orotidine-5'-phosphate decarboxylase [Clostridiales bacterium]
MTNFADKLLKRIEECNNPTVMGLDPKLDYLPSEMLTAWLDGAKNKKGARSVNMQEATGEAIFAYNRLLIDAVYDIIPAIKPQFAYYEMYGLEGIKALKKTIRYAQEKGMLVIADAKRNDIGTTATAYANAIIGETKILDDSVEAMFECDCVTVNGYLGIDGIKPFMDVAKEKGKGLFVLVRTSNPSAGDLQDLKLEDGRQVFEAMAENVEKWGQELIGESGFSSVGAVVGATWPEQAVKAREIMPHALILVPGYGAQGGSGKDAVASFVNGKGGIVNASRSLMCAWKKREDIAPMEMTDIEGPSGKALLGFQKATRDEAIRMRDDLNAALKG